MKIDLMQWQAYRVRGSSFDNKKVFLVRKKETWKINLSDLKFEVLSQDFASRVEESQPMPVGRKRVHFT